MFDVDVVLIIVGVLQYSMTTISLTLPSSWVVVPKRASRLDVMRYDGVRLAASWPMMGHCRGGGLAPDAINHCCIAAARWNGVPNCEIPHWKHPCMESLSQVLCTLAVVKMADRRADRAHCRWLSTHQMVAHVAKYCSILSDDHDIIDRRCFLLWKQTAGARWKRTCWSGAEES